MKQFPKDSKGDDVKPGTLGTRFVGSDRYPMIVVKVLSPKRVLMKHLDHEQYQCIENGAYTGEDILLTMDPKEWEDTTSGHYYTCETYSLRKNGLWYRTGESSHYTGGVALGCCDSYLDPSF